MCPGDHDGLIPQNYGDKRLGTPSDVLSQDSEKLSKGRGLVSWGLTLAGACGATAF